MQGLAFQLLFVLSNEAPPVRTKPKSYVPSLGGSRYEYAVMQLARPEVLNPDAHMFYQRDLYQADPDVVAEVMTQLSLNNLPIEGSYHTSFRNLHDFPLD